MNKKLKAITEQSSAPAHVEETNEADALPNFGMEVNEVEFKEFDRRNKPKVEQLPTGFERRGFLGEVDRLIRDLGFKPKKN